MYKRVLIVQNVLRLLMLLYDMYLNAIKIINFSNSVGFLNISKIILTSYVNSENMMCCFKRNKEWLATYVLIMLKIKLRNKYYQNHSIILNCLFQYKFKWNWCCGRGLNRSFVNGKSDPFELHNTYFDVHLHYAGHLRLKRSKIANR